MKTILVPTDFSKAANNAADYAAHLSREIKAKLLLLHVYHMPVAAPDYLVPFNLQELQEAHEVELKKEAARLKKITKTDVGYKAEMGFAVDVIAREEAGAIMIVMGMRGTSKLSEVLMGSITTTVLRKTNKPVLVIPEKADYRDPDNVVFACDCDSGVNDQAIRALECFTKVFGSKIHVVNVNSGEIPITVKRSRETMLYGQLSDTEPKYHVVEQDDVVEGVNEFVKARHADLVAVVPHRRHFLDSLFHKSITKEMAFHTDVPLLALPDKYACGEIFFF
jgi:nucleotide-binding universal stress UspA family protein